MNLKEVIHEAVCANVLYVAMTRATEKLYLIHHNSNDFLNFIDTNFTQYVSKLAIGSQTKYDVMNIIKTHALSETKDNTYVTLTG